jgi:hypothetical protein
MTTTSSFETMSGTLSATNDFDIEQLSGRCAGASFIAPSVTMGLEMEMNGARAAQGGFLGRLSRSHSSCVDRFLKCTGIEG